MMWISLAGATLIAVGAVAMLLEEGGPGPGSRLRVLFTGETTCELEQCYCDGKMIGGIAPRGGYIASQEGEYLLLDVGCMGCGTRSGELLRLEAVLRGMAEMEYDAANIGEYELWLGKAELGRFLRMGVPFVSANVSDDGGKAQAAPFLPLKKAGMGVAVTGVVARGEYLTGSGLKVDDPAEALARIMPAMREKAGVIIVLADLDVEAARELALRFPEVSLILFRGRGNSTPPERVNRSIIASVAGQGHFLGDIVLSWGEDGSVSGAGGAVLLDKSFPPSESVARASIEWFKRAERAGAGDAGGVD